MLNRITKLHPNTARKYDRAKTQVLYRAPFFGSMMLQCNHIFTRDIPTMATDGKDLLFNPDFVDSITAKELMGVIVHEILHKIFLHLIRAHKYAEIEKGKAVNPADQPKLMKWNMACDYAINPIVIEEGFTLPDGALIDDNYTGHAAEVIYDMLPDDETACDNHFYIDPNAPPMSNQDMEELARQVNIEAQSARTATKEHGNLPSAIKKLLDDNARTKVDWKAVLSEFVIENLMGDDDITFKRPNRRMMVHDLYLPSTEGHHVPPICVMFDTSGSIYAYPAVTSQFIAEIRSIVAHTSPEAVHLMCNDTEVKSHEVFEQGAEIDLELTGGGGTCFKKAFDYMAEINEYPPAINIVFTDLEFNYQSLQSDIPTLWVTYGRPHSYTPPFGTVIHIEDTQ